MYEGQTIGIGIGSTDALSLRVSVASLARVVFEDPGDGYTLLALERKATLHPTEGRVAIKAQPFGGALRIENLLPLKERIGDFHFDSQRSRSDGDFRIYIRPADWGAVRAFCLEQYGRPDGSALEPGPERELVEEFGDILGVDLSPNQYRCTPLWTVLENQPAPTGNIRAENQLTVRLYRVFVVRVTDSDLVKTMISNSERHSDRALGELAREDARQGGKGWANAMLVTPLEALTSFYRTLPEDRRNLPAIYKGFHLEPNVTALLEGVMAPKYQRV